MPADPPNAAPRKRKRRWFQFSLRTLLIVVTLLAIPCGYVGWQAKIVRERKLILWENSQLGGDYRDALVERLLLDSAYAFVVRLPTIREWLGDEPVCEISLPVGSSRAKVEYTRQMFPEARVSIDRWHNQRILVPDTEFFDAEPPLDPAVDDRRL